MSDVYKTGKDFTLALHLAASGHAGAHSAFPFLAVYLIPIARVTKSAIRGNSTIHEIPPDLKKIGCIGSTSAVAV